MKKIMIVSLEDVNTGSLINKIRNRNKDSFKNHM